METATVAWFCDWKLVNENINIYLYLNCLLLIQLDTMGLFHVPCGCTRNERHTQPQQKAVPPCVTAQTQCIVHTPQLGDCGV